MFEKQDTPRVFSVPPGVDFPQALVDGIRDRLANQSPEAIARVELFVNTGGMHRRTRRLLTNGPAGFLPQLRMISTLTEDPTFADIPPAINGLGRRLELAQLVRKLIEAEPDLAAEATAFDLADSLAQLMEEMQGEGVSLAALEKLDVANHSAHWERSQKFLSLVHRFLDDTSTLDSEGRLRAIVERLAETWKVSPPDHPVIIAGSTGSRGTTRLLMQAVANLPQGAVILPGFDTDMPEAIWKELDHKKNILGSEDHPQFRYRQLMQDFGLTADQIKRWTDVAPVNADRNRLVSLALRPAPVTDGWLDEGLKLANLTQATNTLTLVEAPSPRIEAVTIALRLRKAVEDGQIAALITPDRILTRQVTAALQVWNIRPDDRGGEPLHLSAQGRLLRQTAELIGRPASPDTLLALLKHPLVSRLSRGRHLDFARDLELRVLRGGPPHLTREQTDEWASEHTDAEAAAWHLWLWDFLDALHQIKEGPLSDLIDAHVSLTERIAKGPVDTDENPLWSEAAGEKAQSAMAALREVADHGGQMTPQEYTNLLHTVLSNEEIREPMTVHPDIMIWGTLEARVQGADLLILAGLNDGTWPELPKPDPWLNRDMRKQAGLLMPERQIGLSAHDFQQAVAAPEVWITRSVRDAEAETVQSRWLNRIQNLMTGLPGEGPDAFKAMQDRGTEWVALAENFDHPQTQLAAAKRPAPKPPTKARPSKLSVTQIEKLIRDPYAIYARHVLNLKPLKPLQMAPDAALRGTVIHDVLHDFIEANKTGLPIDAETELMQTATMHFDSEVPWPAARGVWLAKLQRAAHWFIDTEKTRRSLATPEAFEVDGHRTITDLDFTLHGRTDRIDRTEDGTLVLYDYKTGQLPTKDQEKFFNKQLPLLATIAHEGGFEGYPKSTVLQASYIGLGAKMDERTARFLPGDLEKIWAEFVKLITEYANPDKGYAARRAVFETRWDQEYDQLSRFGEWDRTDEVAPVEVGK